jgi:hypothetical protein
MSDESRVLDAIDELVDTELEYTPSGWDYSINQPKCPHCHGDAHTLPITQRMQEIRSLWQDAIPYGDETGPQVTADAVAELDAYRYNEDDSPIVCPGAEFVGPPKPRHGSIGGSLEGIGDLLEISTADGLWYSRTGVPLSLLEAESRLADPTYRFIAGTTVADRTRPGHMFRVSTVWLAANFQFGAGPPLIFETLVSATEEDHELDGYRRRYATERQAVDGHAHTVIEAAVRCTHPVITDDAE